MTDRDVKIRCNICKRRFESLEKLRRHEEHSTMHRENLARLNSARTAHPAVAKRTVFGFMASNKRKVQSNDGELKVYDFIDEEQVKAENEETSKESSPKRVRHEGNGVGYEVSDEDDCVKPSAALFDGSDRDSPRASGTESNGEDAKKAEICEEIETEDKSVDTSLNYEPLENDISVHERTELELSSSDEENNFPNEPVYAASSGCISIATPEDKYFLVPSLCFFRKDCIEAFVATEDNVDGREALGKPIELGSVGLRCVFCRDLQEDARAARGVSYLSNLDRLYNSIIKMQTYHFNKCTQVPRHVKNEFNRLNCVSFTRSKQAASYVSNAAKRVGLYDSENRVCLRTNIPPLVSKVPDDNSFDAFTTLLGGPLDTNKTEVVIAADSELLTDYVKTLMNQFSLGYYDESYYMNRKGSHVRDGWPGLVCRHCVNKTDEYRFISPSCSHLNASIDTLHGHIRDCNHCPKSIKASINGAKLSHPIQMKSMESWQLVEYIDRVWIRMFRYVISLKLSNVEKYPTKKVKLCISQDEHVLNRLDCFVRRNIQLFSATSADVDRFSQSRNERIIIPGQIGMECLHCSANNIVQMTFFPESIKHICPAARKLYVSHLTSCPYLPSDETRQLRMIELDKLDRDPETFSYYESSAESLGIGDSVITGIRFKDDGMNGLLSDVVPKVAETKASRQEPEENKEVVKNENFEINDETNAVLESARTNDPPLDSVYWKGDGK